MIIFITTGCGKLNLHNRGEKIFKDAEVTSLDQEVSSKRVILSQAKKLEKWPASDFYAEGGGIVNNNFTNIYDIKKVIPMRRKTSYRALWKKYKRFFDDNHKPYTGSGKLFLNAPIFFDKKIAFVTPSGTLSVMNTDNNYEVEWEFPLQFVIGKDIKKTDQVSLSYGDDKIFIATNNGYIIALDSENGDLLWYRQKNFPIRAPLKYAIGRIYGSSSIGHFFIMCSESGEDLISHNTASINKITKTHPSVLIGNSVVVAGYANGNINAFDLQTGAIVWVQDLSQATQEGFSVMSDVDFTPIYIDGLILAGNINGGIYLIKERDGKIVWSKSISTSSQIIADGEFAFFISAIGELVCMQWDIGAIKWTIKLQNHTTIRLPRYINDNQMTKLVSITNRGPMLVGGKLLIFTNLGKMIVIDPNNGRILQSFIIPYSITDPIAVDGKIFFLSYNVNKLFVMY
ncbi:MAG: PQQ-like beta-propeller repeat protein [Alphaproteobacteria bacterium]|nr:PQQ-like beta-propeller repeat protein [Rickettsiales bacterium]